METITVESKAYQEFMERLNKFQADIEKIVKENRYLNDEKWLDNQDVCELLHLSKRTLQTLRDNGTIPFSQINAKIFYKASDIEEMLNQHYRPAFKTFR